VALDQSKGGGVSLQHSVRVNRRSSWRHGKGDNVDRSVEERGHTFYSMRKEAIGGLVSFRGTIAIKDGERAKIKNIRVRRKRGGKWILYMGGRRADEIT